MTDQQSLPDPEPVLLLSMASTPVPTTCGGMVTLVHGPGEPVPAVFDDCSDECGCAS